MFIATLKGTKITALLQGLSNREHRIRKAGIAGVEAGLGAVRSIAMMDYLNGPRPERLGVITSWLRCSLEIDVGARSDEVIGSLNTDVPYAHYHEHGFHGVIQVRQHSRRMAFASGGKRRGLVTVGFVRAHRRTINYAGRPFLRPALEEGRPLILEEIRKSLAAI